MMRASADFGLKRSYGGGDKSLDAGWINDLLLERVWGIREREKSGWTLILSCHMP